MSDLEYSLYCHQHSFALEQCPDASPDAILYLKTSPEICLERLYDRGRRSVPSKQHVGFSCIFDLAISYVISDDTLNSVHPADSVTSKKY